MAKFKHGDLVQSKAGGPKLVVDSIYTGGSEARYDCIWWVGNKRELGRFVESGLDTWVEPAK